GRVGRRGAGRPRPGGVDTDPPGRRTHGAGRGAGTRARQQTMRASGSAARARRQAVQISGPHVPADDARQPQAAHASRSPPAPAA
ncbi:hypothetical protein AAHZ94_17445, partial [Streptomyces sp. HSW2009]|uniref:hypothetical protein n=1 Tax=Streptomyces sp. HSW2009 TaxID=3142890 RepID=UPI0032EC5FC3